MRDVLVSSGPDPSLLKYALNASINVVSSKSFRQEALIVITECLSKQLETRKIASVDLIVVYQLLNNPDAAAKVLAELLKGSEEDALLAKQEAKEAKKQRKADQKLR